MRLRSEIAWLLRKSKLSSPSPKLQNGFFVDIPKIPNKDEYEHLPGHFTVDRVLSEYSQDRYLVKLRSGEVEFVCVPKCSSITSPSFAFTYF